MARSFLCLNVDCDPGLKFHGEVAVIMGVTIGTGIIESLLMLSACGSTGTTENNTPVVSETSQTDAVHGR